MSFTEEKRSAIRKYMLDKIRGGDTEFIRKTAENFTISETSVRRYLRECREKEILEEDREAPTGFRLRTVSGTWKVENDGMLEEDALFWKKIMPFLEGLPKNVQDIWAYAFTEIMNNAIDHSAGDQIIFSLQKDALFTEISIVDNGIGIFRNIQRYADEKYGVNLEREQAAPRELPYP